LFTPILEVSAVAVAMSDISLFVAKIVLQLRSSSQILAVLRLDIAALHCGNATDDALDGLVTFAKAEEGYLGQMVEAIAGARHLAGNPNTPITATHVAVATRKQQTSARIKALALNVKPARRGRFKLLA
jgi:hypothetical protein